MTPDPTPNRPTFAQQRGERLLPRSKRPAPATAAPAAAPAREPSPAPPGPVPPSPTPAPGDPPRPTPPVPDLAAQDLNPVARRRLRDLYKGTFGVVELCALAAIAVIGVVLRLRDPLSSSIIGAEDPYRHMERTYDLIQGKGFGEYPPGINIITAPFALMGADTFYEVARFLPVVFGLGMIVSLYALSRAYVQPAGALVAAFVGAIAPELVRRTTLLFPTAIDLAVVPLLFLLVLKASEGSRKALVWAGGVSAFLLITHPWVFVLVLPPIGVYWAGIQLRASLRHERQGQVARVAMAAGLVPIAGLVVWALDFGDVSTRVSDHAVPRLSALMSEPGSITPLPLFVDFQSMLGWPLLGLGALGAVAVLVRPTRFGVLTLLYTAMLLPLILVDWFGLWYVPHRTVAYFAIGIALLVGIAASEAVRRIGAANPDGAGIPRGRLGVTLGAIALVGFLLAPAATANPTWYRIYEDDEFQAWEGLDGMDASFVMAGSWQARMGYRATTGNDALYSPDFFMDETSRQYYISQYPDMVVLVDKYTRDANMPTAFLEDGSQWTLIGEWGDNQAYARY